MSFGNIDRSCVIMLSCITNWISKLSFVVAYPHVDFPYENLLSRENKYQHCEADADCSTGSEGITLHCQNMACLGKICVEDPINGCLSGFDCPEQYNCVRPSCGSQLQTEFGICIPLAPMDRLIQSSEIEI